MSSYTQTRPSSASILRAASLSTVVKHGSFALHHLQDIYPLAFHMGTLMQKTSSQVTRKFTVSTNIIDVTMQEPGTLRHGMAERSATAFESSEMRWRSASRWSNVVFFFFAVGLCVRPG